MTIDWEGVSLEELAGYVSEQLRQRGIHTVLVGGACATIYSRGRYQSYDLDFVTHHDMRRIRTILEELGFEQAARYFVRPPCPWYVEFVSPPVAIGDEPIREFQDHPCPLGTIRMLRVEDSVKDRLASYYHWSDREGLERAVEICLEHDVDLEEVRRWSEGERHLERFEEFAKRLERAKTNDC